MNANTPGRTTWFIPDAYLPSCGQGEKWEGHESVCILNAGDTTADLHFELLFDDRPPIHIKNIQLPAHTCRHIGMHKPEMLNGTIVPRDTPYGIIVKISSPVVVQYSRIDVTQPNFALMTTIPYSE